MKNYFIIPLVIILIVICTSSCVPVNDSANDTDSVLSAEANNSASENSASTISDELSEKSSDESIEDYVFDESNDVSSVLSDEIWYGNGYQFRIPQNFRLHDKFYDQTEFDVSMHNENNVAINVMVEPKEKFTDDYIYYRTKKIANNLEMFFFGDEILFYKKTTVNGYTAHYVEGVFRDFFDPTNEDLASYVIYYDIYTGEAFIKITYYYRLFTEEEARAILDEVISTFKFNTNDESTI